MTYTCARCRQTFEGAWSDAEADAEAREQFGVDRHRDPTMAVVCEACYREMTTALPPKVWRRHQES
jgi:hypothetical protein